MRIENQLIRFGNPKVHRPLYESKSQGRDITDDHRDDRAHVAQYLQSHFAYFGGHQRNHGSGPRSYRILKSLEQNTGHGAAPLCSFRPRQLVFCFVKVKMSREKLCIRTTITLDDHFDRRGVLFCLRSSLP